ncbi:MAG: AsnC family transcriptional regulator [Legionellales bacterium RIFCSPHIGHO2_12_FULL_42_9]|nr:MAG: AsnC family transcriptional regulator [Legionellales bacterium RIFCSPHIGHO2_12_FULL_42_9]
MKKITGKAMSRNQSDDEKFLSLDKTDKKILNLLQKNNQLTNLELAELVNLSPPPCLRRVRKLREYGVITQDVSLVNPFKVKQNLISFVSITLEKQGDDFLDRFEQKMNECPEVKQCYFISGDVDYLLMVHVEDIDTYNEFVRRVFVNSSNIKSFRSSFCLSRAKYDTSVIFNDK